MSSDWIHPSNDGSMSVDYKLLDDPESNARLSRLLNEACHVFHDHADGNWATVYKDKYARLLCVEMSAMPFLVPRLLGTGDRVIKMVTYRALELDAGGGSGSPPN